MSILYCTPEVDDDLGDDPDADDDDDDDFWTISGCDDTLFWEDEEDEGSPRGDNGTAAITVSSVTFSGVTRPVGSAIPHETRFWDAEDDVVDVEEQDEQDESSSLL